MSEYLVEIVCTECGNEEYFETDNLPGGAEHCPYCSECSALLPVLPTQHGADSSICPSCGHMDGYHPIWCMAGE